MNQEYLNVDDLSFEYPDGFKALENINLSLSKGERLAVLGPNGCLLYTSPSPRDEQSSRMPSSA